MNASTGVPGATWSISWRLRLTARDDSEVGAPTRELEGRESAQAAGGPGDDDDRSGVHGFLR
jgi:hypothetical protein